MISCTPSMFLNAASRTLAMVSEPIGLLALGNGCVLDFETLPKGDNIKVSRVRNLSENVGVVRGLHQLWEMSQDVSSPDDVLAILHDDFWVEELGWDKRVQGVFDRDPRCGLAGFGGSTALGGDEIYKKPYEVHQLGRRNFFSNMNGAEHHGKRVTEEMPIVFTDGQSMIFRKRLLDDMGGWSWWPDDCVHHAYDYAAACMARRHGYTAWLVPCAVHHENFQTASQPVYKDLADKYGGDAAVHDRSHRFVYEEFRDVLPLRLR
jgi:hypothetical protein